MKELDSLLNVQNMSDQSCDGAGNMGSSKKVMKTKVKKECSMELHVWCHSHRFDLTLEETSKFCNLRKHGFGIVEEFHTFINGNRRHDPFVKISAKSPEKLNSAAGTTVETCFIVTSTINIGE